MFEVMVITWASIIVLFILIFLLRLFGFTIPRKITHKYIIRAWIILNILACLFFLLPWWWLGLIFFPLFWLFVIVHGIRMYSLLKIESTRTVILLYLYALIIIIAKLFFVDAGDGSSRSIICGPSMIDDSVSCSLVFSRNMVWTMLIMYVAVSIYTHYQLKYKKK